MKIITCASYYGSGSSAVIDLVSEYETVQGCDDFEFRFLHDVDGVSDLEYHLTECHNRHNSGFALKRFERLSNFNCGNLFAKKYSRYFSGKYEELTKKYIKSLIDLSYKGWWFYDVYRYGEINYYCLMLVNKILRKLSGKRLNILPREVTYCSHPTKEKFLELTRTYVAELMKSANPLGKKFLALDQLVPSQNISRVLRYFIDDISVLVVNRDPRDVYISNKFYWKECICPYNVDQFCEWYRYTRESGNGTCDDMKHVLYLSFEDLIYKYNDTLRYIENFIGLDSKDHTLKFMHFDPTVSVNNTQLWKKNTYDILTEIDYIEKMLPEYLYQFPDSCDLNFSNNLRRTVKVF